LDSARIDLKKSWLMLKEGKLVPHTGAGRVAHLKLSGLGTGVIEISGRQQFNVFINNRLAATGLKQYRLPLNQSATPGLLTVFSNAGIDQLTAGFTHKVEEDKFERNPNLVSNALVLI
jgi:hypothetical protein